MTTNAALAVADDDRIGSAADAAFEQTRQEIGRTPQPLRAAGLRRFLDRRVAFDQHLLLVLGRVFFMEVAKDGIALRGRR